MRVWKRVGKVLRPVDEAAGLVHHAISRKRRGMTAAQLDSLFELSFTSTSSRVATAMGLAACRSIVRQHDGQIEARSEVGRGTTITVSLPLPRGPF